MDDATKQKAALEISKIDSLVEKASVLLSKCKIIESDFVELNAICRKNCLSLLENTLDSATFSDIHTDTSWIGKECSPCFSLCQKIGLR